MEALATKMMKSKMEKLDIPPIDEFIEILSASGCRLWVCKLAFEMFDLKDWVSNISLKSFINEFIINDIFIINTYKKS